MQSIDLTGDPASIFYAENPGRNPFDDIFTDTNTQILPCLKTECALEQYLWADLFARLDDERREILLASDFSKVSSIKPRLLVKWDYERLQFIIDNCSRELIDFVHWDNLFNMSQARIEILVGIWLKRVQSIGLRKFFMIRIENLPNLFEE